MDALFSAAFALVLIDIIRPANELMWDLRQVMHLLDELIARHMAPAQNYRSDLLQLIELHKKIRSASCAPQKQTSDAIEPESASQLAGYGVAYPTTCGISPDPVWSHVRHNNDGSVPTHVETIMSVIDDLDVDDMNILDAAMLNGDWMWEMDSLQGAT